MCECSNSCLRQTWTHIRILNKNVRCSGRQHHANCHASLEITNEVSLRINSFQAWFNNSLDWWFPGEAKVQSELTDIFGLTYIMSLPISPAAGAVVDFFAGRYRPSGQGPRLYRPLITWSLEKNTEKALQLISVTELKGRKIGVAVVCALCTVLSTVLSLLCTIRGSFSISGKGSLKMFLSYLFLYFFL